MDRTVRNWRKFLGINDFLKHLKVIAKSWKKLEKKNEAASGPQITKSSSKNNQNSADSGHSLKMSKNFPNMWTFQV